MADDTHEGLPQAPATTLKAYALTADASPASMTVPPTAQKASLLDSAVADLLPPQASLREPLLPGPTALNAVRPQRITERRWRRDKMASVKHASMVISGWGVCRLGSELTVVPR